MWNTLKHRNDYICTILINPILIINQFFHPKIIFDKYCSLFEVISDEYCSSFMNKFYSDYFIMFLLFYFIFQKSCTFLKIFFMCIIVNQNMYYILIFVYQTWIYMYECFWCCRFLNKCFIMQLANMYTSEVSFSLLDEGYLWNKNSLTYS